jgi:hypothetical protein
MAYSVGQRTRELAIRIALGAQVNNILRSVTDQGIKIVCIGLIVGIGVALATGRLIEGLLYGVSALDLVTLLISVLVLGIAAGLACLLPALQQSESTQPGRYANEPIAANKEWPQKSTRNAKKGSSRSPRSCRSSGVRERNRKKHDS